MLVLSVVVQINQHCLALKFIKSGDKKILPVLFGNNLARDFIGKPSLNEIYTSESFVVLGITERQPGYSWLNLAHPEVSSYAG